MDDGTANSPIPNAQCRFVNLGGGQRTVVNADENGEFRIVVPPNVEGHISCSPQSLRFLKLSTFSSTMGKAAGETISGEKVDPATTIVAQIIESEHSPTIARRDDLLRSIETAQDHYLTLLVELSTRMYAEMLHHNLDVNFADSGGDGGGNGDGNGDGGGVGGDAGDGGDKSPIANARCEFVIGNNVGGGWSVLYNAALADFREDGVLNRNDLKDIQDIINKEFKGREKEIMAAFEDKFPLGFGQPYYDTTDEKGEYFLPIPPNVPGFVRCLPPGQEQLVLTTYVRGLAKDEELPGQDVNPATTVFSTNVASQLDKDLGETKENFLDDIAGLDVQILQDGGTVSGFRLRPGTTPADKNVGLVAFSATSLFNILYKNGINVDYLAALNDFTSNKEKTVDPVFLKKIGVLETQAGDLASIVNKSVDDEGVQLGTDLGSALSKARLRVTVNDGGLVVTDATLKLLNPGSEIFCDNCPQGTYELTLADEDYPTFYLSGVPPTATDITVEASKEGFKATKETAKVVAFATVDLEIALTTKFTLNVQMAGNGAGTVTGSAGGIDCLYGDAVESGTCNADFDSDTLLTLSANPSKGSTFTGWRGDCSGPSPCFVTMDRARNVTATFTLESDIDLPKVTITSPTSASTYTATGSTLSIGGTASDDVGVTQVTWSNSRGGSGVCTSTTNWSAGGIALSAGTNVITVTAKDASGKTGTDTLTVTYAPPVGGRYCANGNNHLSDVIIHLQYEQQFA